jgi:hypothetical protein
MSDDPKQAALAAIDGLTISDVLTFFYAKATPRDKEIQELAGTSDELEVDGAILSESESNGAWVLGWIWAPFHGTKFTQFCECCENDLGDDEAVEIEKAGGGSEFVCKACAEEIKS